MSPNKFVVAMIGSSFLASWNLEIVSFVHLSVTSTGAKVYPANASDFLYSPHLDIFSTLMFFSVHHYLVCLFIGINCYGRAWCCFKYIRALTQVIVSTKNAALQIKAGQRSITAKLWPLTAHIYHVMIIVTSGSSKKSFLLSLLLFCINYFERSWTCFLGIVKYWKQLSILCSRIDV